MGRFLALRLALLVPTLLGVLVVTFLLLYVAPGDPVQAMVGERADAATIERLRAELRLDDPLPVQFGRYLGQVVQGDLGTSYITGRPIVQDLMERFPATLRLAGSAMLFAALLGIAIGIYGAWRPGSWGDRASSLLAYAGVSFPVYWVGLLLILVFAVMLRWLPASGYGGLAFLVLPAVTLGMRSVAFLSRMTRAAMQEVLRSDFVRTARAKGLTKRRAVFKHALRTALIPVGTLFAFSLAAVFTGATFTETLFGWHGMGEYLVTSISGQDVHGAVAVAAFGAVTFFVGAILSEIFVVLLDPRVRVS